MKLEKVDWEFKDLEVPAIGEEELAEFRRFLEEIDKEEIQKLHRLLSVYFAKNKEFAFLVFEKPFKEEGVFYAKALSELEKRIHSKKKKPGYSKLLFVTFEKKGKTALADALKKKLGSLRNAYLGLLFALYKRGITTPEKVEREIERWKKSTIPFALL